MKENDKKYHNTFIVKPTSYRAIDQRARLFLSKHCPDTLEKVIKTDVEKLLTLIIPQHFGYKIFIDETQDAQQIQGKTDFLQKL